MCITTELKIGTTVDMNGEERETELRKVTVELPFIKLVFRRYKHIEE